MVFAGLLSAAELDQSMLAGLAGGHEALQIFVDGQLQVRGHFGVEFAVERWRTEQC